MDCAKESVGNPQVDSTTNSLDGSPSSPEISLLCNCEVGQRLKKPSARKKRIAKSCDKCDNTGKVEASPITLATEADEAEIVALASECLPSTVAMNANNRHYWMIMKRFGLYQDGPVTLQGWGAAKGFSFEFITKIYKLTVKDTIVGVLVISEPSEHMAASQRNAALNYHYGQQLMVHKDYRGMGIATRLLEHVFAQYDPTSTVWALDVDRENSAAKPLYEKYGFVVRDDTPGVCLVPGSHFMLRPAGPAHEIPASAPTDADVIEECPICLENIEGEGTRPWGCHSFCRECGPKTFAKFRNCPMCNRFKFTADVDEFVPRSKDEQRTNRRVTLR